ncbi:hypothetical protein BV898_02823 [Hypsibius exemplaris]|uniref:Receptor ligand binding region domain-containing protein n=1 Tax=Hypsibius exemplaris TaxID=2072580 RepID=A0A1W0X770_HYPEX|nr:hypothetical protein BV898_02823 [Hypsibius exemplaris]
MRYPALSFMICLFIVVSVENVLTNSIDEVAVVAFGCTAPLGFASLLRAIPLYQLAVEELNRRQSVLNFTFSVVPARNCLAVAVKDDDILAKWYYKLQKPRRIIIFIGIGSEIGCTANDVSVYNMAAELNCLIINSVSGLEINPALLPTALSLSAIRSSSYVQLCVSLTSEFNWTSVFIVWDKNSSLINNYMATSLQDQLASKIGSLCTLRTVASDDATTFRLELIAFRRVSRVLFFFGHATKLRRLLITAIQLNMTDGNFAYIVVDPIPNLGQNGRFTWYNNDINDQEAKEAFRSLIILQPAISNTSGTSNASVRLRSQFNRRSSELFNVTYSPAEQPFQFITSTFDGVILLGTVTFEAWKSGADLSDARQMANQFRDRTVRSDFTDYYVNRNGVRVDNLAIAFYNLQNEQREPFLVQFFNASGILQKSGTVTGWPNLLWPPRNQPICGYLGDSCQTTDSSALLYIVLAATVVGLGLAFVIVFQKFRHHRLTVFMEQWFLLDASRMKSPGQAAFGSSVSSRGLDPWHCRSIQK